VDVFCLNAGGDVVARGEPEPGKPWQVAVRSPWDPRQTLVVLPVSDAALATSGTYERGAHIRDARTGAPATTLLSVTVLADDLVTADVLATTVLALGPEGVGWAMDRFGCTVLAIAADGRVIGAGGA
jgi:thiamine biosynthesis lipoprotein